MKNKIESYNFGENEVKVKKRDLFERVALKFTILQIIGTSAIKTIAEIFQIKQATGKINLKEINIPEIAGHLENLFMNLTPQKAKELIEELLVNVWINDADPKDKEVQEIYFEEDSMFLYKVVGFSLLVQLRSFFFKGSTSELIKIITEKAKSEESSNEKSEE